VLLRLNPHEIRVFDDCPHLSVSLTEAYRLVGALEDRIYAVETSLRRPRPVRPFSVAFDHDGANTVEYRVYLDGVKVLTLPVSALVNGSVTSSPITVTTAAAHSLTVSAFNAGAVGGPPEAISAALALTGCTNCGAPTAPKNLRIQIVATAALNSKGEVTGVTITSVTIDPPVTVQPRKR
jgi:hypothetical protein